MSPLLRVGNIGELRYTMPDGSVIVVEIDASAHIDIEQDLGWTGTYNSRGWPESTGEPDPDKPPRLVIEGGFTQTKYAPGAAPDPTREAVDAERSRIIRWLYSHNWAAAADALRHD